MRRFVLSLMLMLAISVAATAAVITTYTNRGLWNSSLSLIPGIQMFTETFDDGLVNQTGLSVSSDYGGSIVAFQWYDIVNPSAPWETTWTITLPYAGPIAFGGTFDTTPGGAGTGIDVYGDFGSGWEFALTVPNNAASAFYGFIADMPYTQVQFRAGSAGGTQETYNLDDLSYANAVPEPATFVLIGAGLLGLGILGRRRASK